MQIRYVAFSNQVSFGNRYKLDEKTISFIERKTRLSRDELQNLPIDDAVGLMKKRAPINKKIKNVFGQIKLSCGRIYKVIGERLGLLEKQHNIYTDIH